MNTTNSLEDLCLLYRSFVDVEQQNTNHSSRNICFSCEEWSSERNSLSKFLDELAKFCGGYTAISGELLQHCGRLTFVLRVASTEYNKELHDFLVWHAKWIKCNIQQKSHADRIKMIQVLIDRRCSQSYDQILRSCSNFLRGYEFLDQSLFSIETIECADKSARRRTNTKHHRKSIDVDLYDIQLQLRSLVSSVSQLKDYLTHSSQELNLFAIEKYAQISLDACKLRNSKNFIKVLSQQHNSSISKRFQPALEFFGRIARYMDIMDKLTRIITSARGYRDKQLDIWLDLKRVRAKKRAYGNVLNPIASCVSERKVQKLQGVRYFISVRKTYERQNAIHNFVFPEVELMNFYCSVGYMPMHGQIALSRKICLQSDVLANKLLQYPDHTINGLRIFRFGISDVEDLRKNEIDIAWREPTDCHFLQNQVQSVQSHVEGYIQLKLNKLLKKDKFKRKYWMCESSDSRSSTINSIPRSIAIQDPIDYAESFGSIVELKTPSITLVGNIKEKLSI